MDYPPDRTRRSQQYLGNRGLVVLIALLSAFVPLSTDLYLPALPSMGDYFGVSASETNLTLILFFLFFRIVGRGAPRREEGDESVLYGIQYTFTPHGYSLCWSSAN